MTLRLLRNKLKKGLGVKDLKYPAKRRTHCNSFEDKQDRTKRRQLFQLKPRDRAPSRSNGMEGSDRERRRSRSQSRTGDKSRKKLQEDDKPSHHKASMCEKVGRGKSRVPIPRRRRKPHESHENDGRDQGSKPRGEPGDEYGDDEEKRDKQPTDTSSRKAEPTPWRMY